MQKLSRLLSLVLIPLFFGVAGCTSIRTKTAGEIDSLSAIGKGKTVVLLEADVSLSEILAGGVEEPRAEWSKAAAGHIRAGLQTELSQRGVQLVLEQPGKADEPNRERADQVRRLASVVGTSVLFHALLDSDGLPTKKDRLEWTVGPGAKLLQSRYQADYAILTFVRDSYASAGTKALKVLGLATALAFGVGANVSTGQRIGYTMLIDLNSGDVVWANFLQSETGDMREAEGSRKVLANLLKGLPL